MKRVLFPGIALLLLAPSAWLYSQQISGSIVGNVRDASGAVVPDARVTVRNENTGIMNKATTGPSGTYTVPDLLAGSYTVIVRKQGFKTYQATGIRLLSSETARADVVLQVGALMQTVQVTAIPQLVQTDSPTIGATLKTEELSNLPMVTQTSDTAMFLAPGMSQGIVNGNTNPVGGGAPYYGGANFTVNGVTTENPGTGGGGNVTYIGTNEMIANANLPSVGTLQEFKVNTSVVSAAYRSQTAITMVTKQGTNDFHGEVYEYNENKATSANYFENNMYGIKGNPFNRNMFGGNIGGPILHDKLFFFLAYDGLREIHSQPVTENYPTLSMHQGDFSGLCTGEGGTFNASGVCSIGNYQLYNPLTGQPLANNQIPQSMITSQAKYLESFLPLPNINVPGAGLPHIGDWTGEIPLRYGTNNEQARLDYQMGTKDSATAFFSGSRGLPWFYGYQGPGTYGSYVNHGYNWINLSLSETHTFTPTLLNEFRVGWVYALRDKFGQNTGVHPWDLFPGMMPPASPDGGLPHIGMSGYGTILDEGMAVGIQDNVDWVDDLTWVKASHTIKAGFEETGYKEDDRGGEYNGALSLGNFQFSGQWTGNRGWNIPGGGYGQSAGNAFADFLLGYPISTDEGTSSSPYLWSREWDGYVMDTWKATPRLTVDYGVRYMYQQPWTFRGHSATFFDFTNSKLVLPENSSTPTLPPGGNPVTFALYPYTTTGAIGAPLNFFQGDTNNWAPRIGFAYRLTSDNKTVIRGGYGVYYAFNPDNNGFQNLAGTNPPWGGSFSFSTNLPGQPSTPFLPDLSFNDAFPANNEKGQSPHPSITVVDQHLLNPISQQWNLSLERQFGQNWLLRTSYLGDQTHHLVSGGYDINVPNVQQLNVPTQQQAPFQPWGGIHYVGSGGTSNFNQLQLSAEKRFAQGFMFRAEYDWTHMLDNVSWDPGYTPQDPWNLRANYGNDLFQYRHRFLVYYVYQLPVGRGRKWLGQTNKYVDGVLGGWQVSGITTYHSGDFMDVYLENPGTYVGWQATLMDRVPGVPLYLGRQTNHNLLMDNGYGVPWFNPAAFAPPQPGQWGNAAPGVIVGPGFGEWDLSLLKSFKLPINESSRLEFKADFINAPNHFNLGDPSNYIADTRDGGDPDPYAGRIQIGMDEWNGTGNPRIIQLGARLIF